MNINADVITNAIKKAFESKGIKSIPGVNMDDLIKTISESILKSVGDSVDVKEVGGNLMKGLKSALGKDK